MAKDLTRSSESAELHNTDMPMPSVDLTQLDLSALRYTLGKPVFSKDELPEGARITPVEVPNANPPTRADLRDRLRARMKLVRESRASSS